MQKHPLLPVLNSPRTGLSSLLRTRKALTILLACWTCLLVYIYYDKSRVQSTLIWATQHQSHACPPTPPTKSLDQVPEVPTVDITPPSTNLGIEVDLVYENLGSTDQEAYRLELEDFLLHSFPAGDSDLSNPNSLRSIVRDFLPPLTRTSLESENPQAPFTLGGPLLQPLRAAFATISACFKVDRRQTQRPLRLIPKSIFQTSFFPGVEPPNGETTPSSTWRTQNPGYDYQYSDNEAARTFILQRFNGSKGAETGCGEEDRIAKTYEMLEDVPVMQSDLWRYAVLASEGGVYSDIDTKCLKPIDTWHQLPWQRGHNVSLAAETRGRPSVIVGIEVDVEDFRADTWHKIWPRPLGPTQWTMASTRGHPIFIDTLRRVCEATNPTEKEKKLKAASSESHRYLDTVLEKTGPAPFTDALLRYLGAKYNVTWSELRRLPDEGVLFSDTNGRADVLVLPITAFSPGVMFFGAGDIYHTAALVQHLFSGTWRAQFPGSQFG